MPIRNDASLARDLQTQISSQYCVDLTGYTGSIRELLMLFHGADLLIESVPGNGSTFSIVFPASRIRTLAAA